MAGNAEIDKLAVLVEELTPGSPAQQILDRFLIGYPSQGEFWRPRFKEVALHGAPPASEEVARREKDRGLKVTESLAEAMKGAGAVLIAPRWAAARGSAADLVARALEAADPGARIFVYGLLAGSSKAGLDLQLKALERKVTLLSGTYLPVTWRLPPVEVPYGAAVQEALLVAVGEPWEAEILGIDGLISLVERRGVEAGVRSVKFLSGEAVWKAERDGAFSRDLLAAAISRSDTPQGDPVRDGRTQDLVGLGLLPKLAAGPMAYLFKHEDGLRSALLILNGAVADFNFALRLEGGEVISAQLYRPPAPNAHHFSALAQVVEAFWWTGEEPWSQGRCRLETAVQEVLGEARRHPGQDKELISKVSYNVMSDSAFIKD